MCLKVQNDMLENSLISKDDGDPNIYIYIYDDSLVGLTSITLYVGKGL